MKIKRDRRPRNEAMYEYVRADWTIVVGSECSTNRGSFGSPIRRSIPGDIHVPPESLPGKAKYVGGGRGEILRFYDGWSNWILHRKCNPSTLPYNIYEL